MATRRKALVTLAAGSVSVALARELPDAHHEGHDPQPDVQAAPIERKPTYFNERDYATVSRLVDLIIPRTETPGALDAGVPWRIDQAVSRKPDLQPLFKTGLTHLNTAAKEKGKPDFVTLSEVDQVNVLTALSKLHGTPEATFFQSAKALTIEWYYNSEAGLAKELGFKGNTFRTEFPGCTHPEHWPEKLNTKA